MIAVRVILPLIVIFALLRKVALSHLSTSFGVRRGFLILKLFLAISIASLSKSSIDASGQIAALQSIYLTCLRILSISSRFKGTYFA